MARKLISGAYRTEDGCPLRAATPEQRHRRALKRQAQYPRVGRAKANIYRRVAIASLNEAHQHLDYYRSVIHRLARIDREGEKVHDLYLMRDIRRAGGRDKHLAMLLFKARYAMMTAAQFGKGAGASMLPA